MHELAIYKQALSATDPRHVVIDSAIATGDAAIQDATVAWLARELPSTAKALPKKRTEILRQLGDTAPALCVVVEAVPLSEFPSGTRGPIIGLPGHSAVMSLQYRLEATPYTKIVAPVVGGNVSMGTQLASWAAVQGTRVSDHHRAALLADGCTRVVL